MRFPDRAVWRDWDTLASRDQAFGKKIGPAITAGPILLLIAKVRDQNEKRTPPFTPWLSRSLRNVPW